MTGYLRYELELDDLVREIEWLGKTDTPERIAARLGYTVCSLEQRLRREGRPDLAAVFERAYVRGES